MTDIEGSQVDGDLMVIAAEVCRAISDHAKACATEPPNGPVVVPALIARTRWVLMPARSLRSQGGRIPSAAITCLTRKTGMSKWPLRIVSVWRPMSWFRPLLRQG